MPDLAAAHSVLSPQSSVRLLSAARSIVPMAQIVLGLCTSHTPQLSTPAEVWPEHGKNDRRNPWLIDTEGRTLSYQEALERADPRIASELTPEKHQQRHEIVQSAVSRLQQELKDAQP